MNEFFCQTETPQYFNDICDVIRLFFSVKKIRHSYIGVDSEKNGIYHYFTKRESVWISNTKLYIGGVIVSEEKNIFDFGFITQNELNIKKHQKRLIKQNVYWTIKKYMHISPPWGSLTGIRPTKLAREISSECGAKKAKLFFKKSFDVSECKTDLVFDILQKQEDLISAIKNDDLLVYIGIPFCPSRCKYCSFILHDLKRTITNQDLYMDAILNEMCVLSDRLISDNIKSIYIGGGTPSSLSFNNFERLIKKVINSISNQVEFTIECGRPDTITADKLQIMREYGVSRISINPQTLTQRTLDIIGRKHTTFDFYKAFELARKFGFNNINADIIIGLPGEGEYEVNLTVNELLKLKPENITVHTLAIKNSSVFSKEDLKFDGSSLSIGDIISGVHNKLSENGYNAYYLYRQKYMNGNLENTGYAKPGYNCIYNVGNMEEIANILAFGCGAISKKLYVDNRIERFANSKDIEHYILRHMEYAKSKRELFC